MSTKVSLCHCRHKMVSVDAGQKKGNFLSPNKGERREVGTTVTIIPCVPVILCALLAYTDLVAELDLVVYGGHCKWLEENRVTMFAKI